MTLEQFRSDKQLVSWFAAVAATAQFGQLLEALRDSHPKNFRARGEHLGDNAHYKLGRIDGYDEFENNLLSAMQQRLVTELVAAAYQPEDS